MTAFAAMLAAGTIAQAGLTTGMYAELEFQQLHLNVGGEFLDFESVIPGTDLLPGADLFGVGARFASIIDRDGTSFGPEHVEVSSRHRFAEFGNSIVGSPFQFGSDDARVGYEITFDEVQRRAGLRRIWNTSSTTSFFNAAGELLATHQNTENAEFVGYIADSSDESTWVARILMDGVLDVNGDRSVGHSDDLYFGRLVPAPSALSVLLCVGVACARRRR